ncbi:MAG: AI-2E family transporter, partial [Bacteroidota bacterium]
MPKTTQRRSQKPLPQPTPENVVNVQVVLLSIIAISIIGFILLELKAVLLPFVIAVLLSIIFSPIVTTLKKRNIPTALSLIIVLITFALVLFLVALLIYSSTESFINEIPKYEQRLARIVDGIVQSVNTTAAELDIDLQQVHWSQAFQLSSLAGALTSGIGSFLNFLANLFLMLLFMLFILAGSGDLGNKIRHAFADRRAIQLARMIANIESRVRQYLFTKTVVSAGTGIASFLVLWILGVDFPLVWAFLTFLLHYIPNIGSIIAIILPCALAFLQFDSAGPPVVTLILLSIIHMTMGNVVEPKLMAFQLDLSPLMVLVSLIFWGWLWGAWGMILAVPIMATIKIVFENVDS